LLRDWFGVLAHRGAGTRPFDGPGLILADLMAGESRPLGDLVYGVRWVLEDMAGDQPVMLVVDDLQWADEDSLHALDLLVNTLQHQPCLVVYAVRAGEQVSAPESLSRVRRASTALALEPLSRAAVAEQVRASRADADDRLVDEVFEATGGVPFFVTELLSAPAGTSDAVIASVVGRVNRVGKTAEFTAQAACLLDGHASVGTVAELTQQPVDVVADDISGLVSAQVLDLESGAIHPRLPMISDAILAGISASDASAMHATAARILAGRGAARATVARHLANTMAGTDPDVRKRLHEHGEQSMQAGEPERAIQFLERALAEGPVTADDVGLLGATARAKAATGRLDEAITLWERAVDLTDEETLRDQLRGEIGDALVQAGRHHDALETFGSLLEDADRGPARQRLVVRMVMAGLISGASITHLREQVTDVLAHDRAADSPEDRLSLAAGAVLQVFEGRPSAEVHELVARAISGGRLLEEETADGAAIYLATGVLGWLSAYAEADVLLSGAVDDARSRGSALGGTGLGGTGLGGTGLGGSVLGLANASACRGTIRMRMGMITEAVADLEVAMAQRSTGWNTYLGQAAAALVECRVARGELDQLAPLHDELEGLSHVPGMTGAYATYALADLAAANGDHERAAQMYAGVGRLVGSRMDNPAILPWRAGESLARIRLGQHREAVALSTENLRRAREFGAPFALAQALRTQSAVDPTGDRVQLLREAMDLLRETQAPRLEAQVATDLAGMLILTQGNADHGEIVGLLRRAESFAGFQELRPLAERVHRLLERVGEPVKRSVSDAVSALTVSERRVADLAASGLSNRQIAQQLFVTVKAVEWHLSNVYRKLGIRSRTRLPAVLSAPAQRPAPKQEGLPVRS
jgi:DNA-binding CsgD family transcriptional regulator/tetratricopeptide (TPR) repeat protein